MRLFAMHQQYGVADFVDIRENRHIDERQDGRLVNPLVGVGRTAMVATFRLVVVVILAHEE